METERKRIDEGNRGDLSRAMRVIWRILLAGCGSLVLGACGAGEVDVQGGEEAALNQEGVAVLAESVAAAADREWGESLGLADAGLRIRTEDRDALERWREAFAAALADWDAVRVPGAVEEPEMVEWLLYLTPKEAGEVLQWWERSLGEEEWQRAGVIPEREWVFVIIRLEATGR